MDRALLEMILERKALEDAPVKLLHFESSNPLGKNNNFLSIIERLEVTLLLGSGKKKTVYLIVKHFPAGEFMQQVVDSTNAFVKEITVYRDILPMIEELMAEFNDNEGPMWAKFYGSREYDQLVLEDLSVAGYKMKPRTERPNLETCLLVIKNIAKFHAFTHILIKKNAIPKEIFGSFIWNDIERNKEILDEHNRILLMNMETWGDEWNDVRTKFEHAIPTLAERFLNIITTASEPSDFLVLNHGDCWKNNIMYNDSPESESPTSMKFLDFQASFIGPLSYDLDYFFFSSVHSSIYSKHWDQLIETYSKTLDSTLKQLNYEENIPTLDSIKTLMKRTHVIFLQQTIIMVPFRLGNSDDVPDINELLQDYSLGQGKNTRVIHAFENMKQHTKEDLQFALLDAIENGVI